MRGGKYNAGGGSNNDLIYDDNSFQLFAIAFLAVFWVPVALYRIIRTTIRVRHIKTPLEKAKEAWCTCSFCQDKAGKLEKKNKGLRAITFFDFIFLIVTILLAISAFRLYRTNVAVDTPFDPFRILNVDHSSTPKQIKKAYRRLTVTHHPDKNRNDPSAGEKFIEITKAFAALTDPTAKENYIKYGNPDGYLGTTWGLGLPQWVAESQNSVLFAYAIFMILIFPVSVGIWWHNRKKQLTSEVMTSTFMMYRETLQQTTRFRDLLAAFCGSDEFNDLYNSDNEEIIRDLSETLRKSGVTDLRKTKSFVEPSFSQLQNLLVMTAYLARVPIPEKLVYVRDGILARAEPLLTALTDTVGVFQRPDCKAAWDKMFMHGHTTYLTRCVQLTQCIYQGMDEKSSPLLQLPHFTEREVRICSGGRGSGKSIYDIMRMESPDLRKLLRDMDDNQILDIQAFLERYPSAMLEVEAPRVEGEEDQTVHEGDNVTVRARLRVLRRNGSAFSPCTRLLPFRKEEVWWLWLADQRLLCPIGVRRLLPRMARGHGEQRRRNCFGEEEGEGWVEVDEEDDDSSEENVERRKQREEELERLTEDPRVTVFEVTFRFVAPRAGTYMLELKTMCDSYAGASKSVMVRMEVLPEVEPPPEEPMESELEDSEEEESDESEEEKETDGEYEYIEVTDSESEGEMREDDGQRVSKAPKGNRVS